jgi:hypothetical protein
MTMLYRSTDCLCRCGAPMKNLAHSASLESLDKNAPSKPGTKHLTTDIRLSRDAARRERLFDVGEKGLAVHRAVEDHERNYPS